MRITHDLGAFFRHVIAGRPLPKLTWSFEERPNHSLRLAIQSEPAPKAGRLWRAQAPTKDFREARWTETDLPGTPAGFGVEVKLPEEGSFALFGDLTYEIDGIEYHLSTQIRQVNPPEGQ